MQQSRMEREVWIAAPRERVWRAVSEPEQIGRWLLPPVLGAQLRGDGEGRLLVGMGPMEVPLAQLEAIVPLRQLTLRGLPDKQAAATLILSEANGGTRVVVQLSGFERAAEGAQNDRLAPGLAGWEKTLRNLQAAIAEVELPFPEGYVAALFGYRRETAERFAVERSIWIAASPERVWRAVTDPAQIEQWFSPGTSWTLTALEVGGRLFVPDPATGEEQYTQVLTVVEPPRRLAMRTMPEPSGNVEVTTYSLAEEGDGTRLTIVHAGYALLPADARWNAMEQNSAGFGMMLENVRAVVEGLPLPYPRGF
ncbi:MAG TPA: SRPBCC domain-containing protein [Chloroflexaceae bacterium]|nr:SRPBCC domain-containing protein [Chloroflexaceae bacterium]